MMKMYIRDLDVGCLLVHSSLADSITTFLAWLLDGLSCSGRMGEQDLLNPFLAQQCFQFEGEILSSPR